MWEDEDDDNDYNPEEERQKLKEFPLYKKAMEIFQLTRKIVDSFEEGEMREPYTNLMLEDAMVIGAKIAGAFHMDDYIIKMENATVIKMHARSLLTFTSGAKGFKLLEPQYLQLLRNELEEFRLMFREWVQTFEIDTVKEGDGWGLFVSD